MATAKGRRAGSTARAAGVANAIGKSKTLTTPTAGVQFGAITTKVFVTFFSNAAATTLTTELLTLEELAGLVRNTARREKSKLSWLKLGRFGDKRTGKNCLRHDDNLEQISGIEIDCDTETIAYADMVAVLKELNVKTLAYTSPSHTKGKPRWRILAPTSQFLPPSIRATLVARLNGALKAKLGADKVAALESFTLSQSYFYGWIMNKLGLDHHADVIDGDFIDQREDLEIYEVSGWPALKNVEINTDEADDPDISIDWAVATQHVGWLKSETDLPADFSTKGRSIVAHAGSLKDLNFNLDQAGLLAKPYASWSEVVFALAAIFKADGRFSNEQIAAAAMADLQCNQHIAKIRNEAMQRRAIERLIVRSHTRTEAAMPDWRERRKNGSPLPSMHNARLAIEALGIECSYDTFHNKLLVGYRDDISQHVIEQIVGEVSDNGIIALRQLMSDAFGYDLTDQHTRDAVISLALEHCFNPVVDMLSEAEGKWDRVERLDRLAADYFNCEDTQLNAACMRKTLLAAVARAQTPGVKFDEILVLESEEGFNKSTAWRVLAGDENFSDEKIIGKDSREVQEQLAGVWIHENADLAGLKKAEVETVKNYASKQVDRARPAYGRFLKNQPRHSIEVGTTNSVEYLQSQTGNRRFWPMRVLRTIDIEKLRRDRLQILGEAAHCLSRGESLVLDEKLWLTAGLEQEHRRVKDPWEDILHNIPDLTAYRYFKDGAWHEGTRTIVHPEIGGQEQISSEELLTYLLGIPPGNQLGTHTMRLALILKKHGWERHTNGYVTINGKRMKGYYRTSKERPGRPE